MIRQRLAAILASIVILAVPAVRAADPPHDDTNLVNCNSCHTASRTTAGDITHVAGTTNLCLSCHDSGSLASASPFDNVVQANTDTDGWSHRWDSSTLCYVRIADDKGGSGLMGIQGSPNATLDRIVNGTITTGGATGVAQFSWADNVGGSGSATTGPAVSIGDNLFLTFRDDPTTTTTSFPVGETFVVYSEPVGIPSDPLIAAAMVDGKVTCTTCHDQHANTWSPFLRISGEYSLLCQSCHPERFKGTYAQDHANVGYHPTGLPVPQRAGFVAPVQLPLQDHGTPGDATDDTVECRTCHDLHGLQSPTLSKDGRILRVARNEALCQNCHTLTNHHGNGCFECHTSHLTDNVMLVAQNVGGRPMTLPSLDPGAFTKGAPNYDGMCETCHTSTAHYRNDGSADQTHFSTQSCTNCHVHRNSFAIRPEDCLACHQNQMKSSPTTTTTRRPVGPEFTAATGHHPFSYNPDGDLNDPQNNNCLICHLEHSYFGGNHGDGTVDLDQDPDGSGSTEWQTTPGVIHSWCVDCHDGNNPNPAHRLGGQVASDKSFMATTSTHTGASGSSGAIFDELCKSCHVNGHTARVQFFSIFYGLGMEEDACYGCHGGAANVSTGSPARYQENLKVAYPGTGSIHPRSKHWEASMAAGDGKVGCRNCHDPHRLDHDNNVVCDPDAKTTSWGGAVDNAWCLKCHDGSPATAPVHNGFTTSAACTTCHLSHASTNTSLVQIAELASETISLSPAGPTVSLPGNQQFVPVLTPTLTYLTAEARERLAVWGIEGISGGSTGATFHATANIPLDRSVGYDPAANSGNGLITVTNNYTVVGGPTTVDDVNLYMNVQHHYRGDLEIWLRNLTTGISAQVKASDWSDGTPNLFQMFSTESPTPPGGDLVPNPSNTGSAWMVAYIASTGYTGPPSPTYTFTITTGGKVGTARYNWNCSTGGSGTNVLTTTSATDLGNGIRALFSDYYGWYSFASGDTWTYKPLQPWQTVESFKPFNERNSNATWQVELRDTWPMDNSTNPASADYCKWTSWDLVFNSGVVGSLSDTGMFQSQYVGSANVYATQHHGRIWPVQSGLSDAVFENPLPITATTTVTVSNGLKKAAEPEASSSGIRISGRQFTAVPKPVAERYDAWKSRVEGTLPKELQAKPHDRSIIGDRACVNCHGSMASGGKDK